VSCCFDDKRHGPLGFAGMDMDVLLPDDMKTSKTNDLEPEEKPQQSKDVWDFNPNDYFGKILNRIRGKIAFGNRTGWLVNKIGPRRIIIVLAFAWISLVVCSAWGDYETDWLMHHSHVEMVLFRQADYDFAETMMVLGLLGSFLIFVGILIMQFKFVKSKLVTWMLGAIPITAILVIFSDAPDAYSGWDDTTTSLQIGKFIGYVGMSVLMNYLLLILPFIIAARTVIGIIRTILRSLLGLKN
jgi:hypothetical protein